MADTGSQALVRCFKTRKQLLSGINDVAFVPHEKHPTPLKSPSFTPPSSYLQFLVRHETEAIVRSGSFIFLTTAEYHLIRKPDRLIWRKRFVTRRTITPSVICLKCVYYLSTKKLISYGGTSFEKGN